MATMSLHRAGRLQEQIRTAIRETALDRHAVVSIFGDPTEDVARRSRTLTDNIARIEALLDVLALIRARTGKANAEIGISSLLAEKAAHDEWLTLISKLFALDRKVTIRAIIDPTILFRDPETLAAEVQAMRQRFESSDADAETTLRVALLDSTTVDAHRAKIATKRRRVEEISDRLRQLNTGTIEIDDDALAYLRAEHVI